jgi:hypothetical protein
VRDTHFHFNFSGGCVFAKRIHAYRVPLHPGNCRGDDEEHVRSNADRIVASIGVGLVCLGTFSFFFLSNTTPVAVIVVMLMGIGIGLALFNSPNADAVMSSVKPQNYAVAAAIASTTQTLGNTFSLSITMLVFALVIGSASLTASYAPELLASLRIIFGIFAAMCVGGIFTSLVRGKQES